jgi:glycerol-3-phosphate dehydrogenase
MGLKSMKDKQYDYIIIGAGIIGCMIARFLSRYKLDILLIEKEYDIGTQASAANSSIIHSGHDPEPGTLKAKLNIKGNLMWEDLSKELSIPFKKTGSYVVAIGEEELKTVKALYERAILNGVPGIKILKKNEILYREPKINPEVTGALMTPTAGVIDTFAAVIASCENAITNGVKLLLNTKFENFIFDKHKIIGITTNKGNFYSRWVINAAGLYCDEVMHKANIRNDYTVKPVRGEYLIYDASKVEINTVLYPIPTEKGKGTLVTTTTHGNVMIGPNAKPVDSKESNETSYEGLTEIAKNAKKIIPSLDLKNVIALFAGIRAKGNNEDKDFIIEIPQNIKGLVNLGTIESPGLASSPAIAKHVIMLLKENGEIFKKKKDWNPIRKAKPYIKDLSHKERKKIIKKNPLYGRIICRCEEITEGEIIDAIHSPVPALTYNAVKRRTWLGTGRCQGSFDYPKIIEILSRELKVPITEITKSGEGSWFIKNYLKENIIE